jgi:uncharacterized membrane protein
VQVRSCEICGVRPAKYVCQECSRNNCQACFEPNNCVCRDCYGRSRGADSSREYVQSKTFFRLFLVGCFLVFVGTVFLMVSTVFFGATANFAGVIFVGPIPIVIGAGPDYLWAIALAFFLTIFGLAAFVLLRRRFRQEQRLSN